MKDIMKKTCALLALLGSMITSTMCMSPSEEKYDKTLDSTLLKAAYDGDTDTVKALLNNHANPNAKNVAGYTPLMLAACNGNKFPLSYDCSCYGEIIKILIQHGSDPNMKNMDGETALMISVQSNRTEATKILLDNGAAPNIQDQNGNTALMHAALYANFFGSKKATIRILLVHGADPTIKNNKNQTARMIAAEHCHLEIFDRAVDEIINEHNVNVGNRLLAAGDNWSKCPFEILDSCIQPFLKIAAEEDLSGIELEHALPEELQSRKKSQVTKLNDCCVIF
jgi:ankyrin repeat protein